MLCARSVFLNHRKATSEKRPVIKISIEHTIQQTSVKQQAAAELHTILIISCGIIYHLILSL